MSIQDNESELCEQRTKSTKRPPVRRAQTMDMGNRENDPPLSPLHLQFPLGSVSEEIEDAKGDETPMLNDMENEEISDRNVGSRRSSKNKLERQNARDALSQSRTGSGDPDVPSQTIAVDVAAGESIPLVTLQQESRDCDDDSVNV